MKAATFSQCLHRMIDPICSKRIWPILVNSDGWEMCSHQHVNPGNLCWAEVLEHHIRIRVVVHKVLLFFSV